MPRFVLLDHDWPARHWDLMLEAAGVLRTWRLAAPPTPDHLVAAEASFEHRLAYLTYEGPVSGERGRVVAWDRGTFEWLREEAERVEVAVQGERLRGILCLQCRADGRWELRYEPATPANDGA